MIRPASFTSNPETAKSNSFQAGIDEQDAEEVKRRARDEFDGLKAALEAAGVEVLVFEDTPDPVTPDALFPNNWLSTHADGSAILYPMAAPSRRAERRQDILEALKSKHHRQVTTVHDLSSSEDRARFLEGTGSLVLDRRNHVAYACLSSRTNPALFHDWCERFDYEPEAFTAVSGGKEIYHTNVMMCVGDTFAVICDEAIPDEQERIRVLSRLERSGHELVPISTAQMNQFAGNMLQLLSRDGKPILAMSAQARNSLDDSQIAKLERHVRLVSSDISTIEKYAGGSVRCMLAENFLPRQGS
ncbi:citrulline utilization hydrolase CtlX [Natronospira bacteriovora]|uniref:Arginine deiminase-related protein n=1 Tax=Natronospira bacteriovora TaxID=3069753 RepID=A0ABU0W953_9GAMM|nr:arginine deiminase-related protein [Natronospira sp. AB-CW4]MDQ2070569.1 arginine deiminase-related protein [Natronospira sp. AB-CW4]